MGLPVGNIEELFLTSFQEICVWFGYYAVVMLLTGLLPKGRNVRICVGTVVIILMLVFWGWHQSRAELLIAIINTVFVTMLLFGIPNIGFESKEIPFILMVFFIPPRFFNSSYMVFGAGLYFLFMLVGIMGLVFVYGLWRTRPLVMYYMAFIVTSAFSIIYNFLGGRFFNLFRYRMHSSSVFLVISELASGALILIVFLLVMKKLRLEIMRIYRIGIRTTELNKYIWILTITTVIILVSSHLPFVFTRTSSDVLQAMMAVFYIVIFFMQILFLGALCTSSVYKENVSLLSQKEASKGRYYRDIDQNLAEMQDLRHDMKNLLLTMNQYIERSDDEELKEFYKTKVYKITENAINRNSCFAMLTQIPDDILKSFLYMKIEQALEAGINLRLKVEITNSSGLIFMDIMDLTRVLGILMDNAIEAASEVPVGFIEVRIARLDTGCTYTIKNNYASAISNRPDQRGYTTKQGHTGLGLSIVKRILALYPEVIYNTVIEEDMFIQSISVR